MYLSEKIPVIAFADSHLPYLDMDLHADLNIKFCTDLDDFFEEVLSSDFSGMILEMRKVMKTPACDRNKIFSLAAAKPLMRSKARTDSAVLVDDPIRFCKDCMLNRKGQIRRYERADVDLQIQVSREDDHVMARESCAEVLNLSETGCFIKTGTDFSENRFLHLKFHDISDKLPIYGAVRWSTTPRKGTYGYGIQFVSIRPGQKNELLERHIRPNLNS